jgi:hypothetical protein
LDKFTEQQLTDFIRSTLKSASFKDRYILKINDIFVCSTAWQNIYGISSYKWKIALATLDEISFHGNTGSYHYAPWRSHVSSWLTFFLVLIVILCQIVHLFIYLLI